MDNIFVIRGRIQELYANHSRIFDKAIQFLLALVTFWLINQNVGFMKVAASPLATLALAVICTFFPLTMTVIAAAGLILAHMFAASLGVLAVTALVFLIMFIFYFRLTPKMALVALLTPVAFALKIPYVIPIAYALISGPVCLVAISCGTIVYYMMKYVEKAAPSLSGKDKAGLLGQISAYVKQVFQNKEMWIIIVAFIICFLLVYTIRRQSADHAWEIAVIAGAVTNIIVITIGDIALGVHTSYGVLIVGSVLAVVIGLVLELFFFSVDYARSETLQFEDDEYYYYVKAVPKISVAIPEKTIKRINECQETEIIDPAEVRKKAKNAAADKASKEGKPQPKKKPVKSDKRPAKRPAPKKGPSAKKHAIDDVDKMLLTQSLKQDLNLRD